MQVFEGGLPDRYKIIMNMFINFFISSKENFEISMQEPERPIELGDAFKNSIGVLLLGLLISVLCFCFEIINSILSGFILFKILKYFVSRYFL